MFVTEVHSQLRMWKCDNESTDWLRSELILSSRAIWIALFPRKCYSTPVRRMSRWALVHVARTAALEPCKQSSTDPTASNGGYTVRMSRDQSLKSNLSRHVFQKQRSPDIIQNMSQAKAL
jgi:hypothetical protein